MIPAKQRAKCELARIWRLPRGSHTPLLCSGVVDYLIYERVMKNMGVFLRLSHYIRLEIYSIIR